MELDSEAPKGSIKWLRKLEVVKKVTYYSHNLHSYEDTKKLIDDLIYYYNNERIQQNLGWKISREITA